MPKKRTICLDGDIYKTNNCGDVEVLETVGRYKDDRIVKIKFLDTGTILNVNAKRVVSGKVRDPARFMYEMKDKVFTSDNYGTFKIIGEAGTDNNNQRLVRIKFDLTGYEAVARYDAVLRGKVKDPTYYDYTLPGKIMESNNYGQFEIIQHIGMVDTYRHVKIRFLHTGSEVIVRYDDARTGEVRDPAYDNAAQARNILGIKDINNLERYLFVIWKAMHHRCKNDPAYAGKGVTICKEWYNFEIFKNDVMNIPGWQYKFNDPMNYELDKDLFQYNIPHNKRVYSKDTCVWLHKSLNVSLAVNSGSNVSIYYDHIYEIDNIYFVKTDIVNYFNFGPFFDLNSAINMLNYCYAIFNLPLIQTPQNGYYPMNINQIMATTEDRKILCTVVKDK